MGRRSAHRGRSSSPGRGFKEVAKIRRLEFSGVWAAWRGDDSAGGLAMGGLATDRGRSPTGVGRLEGSPPRAQSALAAPSRPPRPARVGRRACRGPRGETARGPNRLTGESEEGASLMRPASRWDLERRGKGNRREDPFLTFIRLGSAEVGVMAGKWDFCAGGGRGGGGVGATWKASGGSGERGEGVGRGPMSVPWGRALATSGSEQDPLPAHSVSDGPGGARPSLTEMGRQGRGGWVCSGEPWFLVRWEGRGWGAKRGAKGGRGAECRSRSTESCGRKMTAAWATSIGKRGLAILFAFQC